MTTIEEALAQVQSGYRSDVAALAKVLADAELFPGAPFELAKVRRILRQIQNA